MCHVPDSGAERLPLKTALSLLSSHQRQHLVFIKKKGGGGKGVWLRADSGHMVAALLQYSNATSRELECMRMRFKYSVATFIRQLVGLLVERTNKAARHVVVADVTRMSEHHTERTFTSRFHMEQFQREVVISCVEKNGMLMSGVKGQTSGTGWRS